MGEIDRICQWKCGIKNFMSFPQFDFPFFIYLQSFLFWFSEWFCFDLLNWSILIKKGNCSVVAFISQTNPPLSTFQPLFCSTVFFLAFVFSSWPTWAAAIINKRSLRCSFPNVNEEIFRRKKREISNPRELFRILHSVVVYFNGNWPLNHFL